MFISINSLIVDAKSASKEIDSELVPEIASFCGIKESDVLSYTIQKRSLDARKKPSVKILYRLSVELRDSCRPKRSFEKPAAESSWIPPVSAPFQYPVIVGAGPAGLFAAYALALAGCHPVVLEQGYDVERRRNDVNEFFRTRQVNPKSNFLFGEGGAGTWSDGKLYTRIHDPAARFVLKAFVECGADPAIEYFSHPHIGSDKLPLIIAALRKKIQSSGGSFQWGTRVRSIQVADSKCTGVILENGEILEAPAVLLASGHGSRELIRSLIDSGVSCEMKGFQIGIRMEHPQEWVNFQQYGVRIPYPALGAAEYNYCSHPAPDGSIRGAVTFCMCPGGEIIPAVCTPERLCTNGMSESARSGKFANSALVTEVPAGTFRTPAEAFFFLDDLESRVFQAGGSDYTAPAQKITDFLSGKKGPLSGLSSYRFGLIPARLDQLMPQEQSAALKRALGFFSRNMPGFADGVLIGMETRVSSPVRFPRNKGTLQTNIRNLYIGGEGAGMAGGIVSAAVDGLNLASAMCGIKKME